MASGPAAAGTGAAWDSTCSACATGKFQWAEGQASCHACQACDAGTYRAGCDFSAPFNAWVCTNSSLTPARLIIESMDADHTHRSLVPVALASGGYVDLMNAGWDHQRALDCGGYNNTWTDTHGERVVGAPNEK